MPYDRDKWRNRPKCQYIYKQGPKQGEICNKGCREQYCYKHKWNYGPKYLRVKGRIDRE